MYGWRARLGLIIPANNTVIEPELNKIAPTGVSVHATRIWAEGKSMEDQLRSMEERARDRIVELGVAEVDVIVYACMATGLVKGLQWAEAFASLIEKDHGIRATTASRATVAALRHLSVKKIALVTPYPPELSHLLLSFFKSCGFEVTGVRNFPISDLREVCRVPPEMAYRLGRDLKGVEFELICIMATDFRTVEAIEALEQDLAKPVISTNQAILWQALRIAGVNEEISGYGILLRNT